LSIVALLVVTAWLVATAWAWLRAPGKQALDQLGGIWQIPWGRQVFVDFAGLEVVLALWMLSDAAAQGTMVRAVVCLVAMPVFGAMPAAVYWLLRGV
jgi:hypothetical protein